MRISVIIPVLNEATTIAATLDAVLGLNPHEVIVADGGSVDHTGEIAAGFGIPVFTAERARALQMNCGAAHATGDVLLFLHADTRLPHSAFRDIAAALENPRYVGGRFDLELDGKHWMLPVIGALINCRSRATQVGTGDQAIFVRRETFMRLGGYPNIALMEDIALCRSLKRQGQLASLRSRVVTSARRWESEGVWRTIFKMWLLKLCYFAGVAPARLKPFYADIR